MGFFRVLLCILFPPLAVLDKGCGSILITTLLTVCGWVPGVIAALIINNKNETVIIKK
ncbi:YqaE/Pmp3 family membrane protein [candidate division KSB1 bacterium]|nr:YqaE/Pmp3 family membrane protein [candidate division KSB1 bacterium]